MVPLSIRPLEARFQQSLLLLFGLVLFGFNQRVQVPGERMGDRSALLLTWSAVGLIGWYLLGNARSDWRGSVLVLRL